MFKKAEKTKCHLKMALTGPSGSGKTYTALALASGIGKKIALIDTEGGSASKYADKFNFDTVTLTNFSPERYIDAMRAAVAEGYDVLIMDSMSHAWDGTGGILEQVEIQKKKSRNQFSAWADPSKLHKAFINSILNCPVHVIATMRVKTAYEIVEDGGKKTPKKIGLAPVQRDQVEYEFDIVAELTQENTFIVAKTRCSDLNGYVTEKAGKETAEIIKNWLTSGVDETKAPTKAIAPAETVHVEPVTTEKAPVRKEEPKTENAQPAKEVQPEVKKAKQEQGYSVNVKQEATQTLPEEVKTSKSEVQVKAEVKSIVQGTIYSVKSKLLRIAEKDNNGGKVYGLILEGEPNGFRTYSIKTVEKAKAFIGQIVELSILPRSSGLDILSIKGE